MPSSAPTPTAKEALLAEAEAIDISDADAARAALRTIGDKWDAIGKVPRERAADLERRMRAVEKKVRDAASTRLVRPRGPGPGRPVPGARRAVRAPGGEGRGRRAHQGRRAGTGQRRAVAGVGRGGGRGAGQEALGAGLLGRRLARSVGRTSGRLEQASCVCALRPTTLRRRSSSAASCTAVRDHTTRAQWNVSRITAIQAMISPMPGPGCGSATVWRDHTASMPIGQATAEPASAIQASAQRRVSSASIENPTLNTSDQPDEHPRRQGDGLPHRGVVADQDVEAPGAAGVRQQERQQNHEHQDRHDQSPCAGIDFACDASFGGLDVALELVELASLRSSAVTAHIPAFGGALRAPTPGMPSPTLGVTCRPASCASPARVRRWSSTSASAIRWCGAAPVTVVVTTSPGRMSRATGGEVHQPAVAGAAGHPCGAGVLAALAGGDQHLDGAADLRGVLLQRDPLLQLDQALIPLLHNRFGQLVGQVGGRGAGPLRVLEGERGGEPRAPDHVEGGLRSPPRSRRGTRR